MRVKNINGTTGRRCNCGSWLQHWRNNSGQTATQCRALGCSRTDLVGAQVQKNVIYDNKWYIVPLCKYHNQQGGSIELVSNTNLVSVYCRQTQI